MIIISLCESEQEPSSIEVSIGKEQADDLPPIACDLAAIAPEQRATHEAYAKHLHFGEAQEILELTDGYALRFEADNYSALTEFVANERLCCPFFRFVLEVTPAQGPVWLRLTGHNGVKEFVSEQFNR